MASIFDIVTINVTRQSVGEPNNLQQKVVFFTQGGSNINSTLTDNFKMVAALSEVDDILTASTAAGDLKAKTELKNKLTCYFANTRAPCYVAEVARPATAALQIANITTFLTNNPKFYLFALPDTLDASTAELGAFLANYTANDAQKYFTLKVRSGTSKTHDHVLYTGKKSLIKFFTGDNYPIAGVQATDDKSDSHPDAAFLAMVAGFTASYATKSTPYAYRPVFGVAQGLDNLSESTKVALNNSRTSVVLTGFEGGLTSLHLFYGKTSDNFDFRFYYAGDWAFINVQTALANEILNGAANSANPLRYDADGIARLGARIDQLLTRGKQFGLFTDKSHYTFVDVDTYKANNPTDFANGEYKGFVLHIYPEPGLLKLTFNLVLSNTETF